MRNIRGWALLCVGLIALFASQIYAQERWVYRYNGPADGSDGARAIVYGSDDNIYAAGYSRGTSTDLLVVSLTGLGDTNWVYTYNGPVDATDEAYSIARGSGGDLYVAGGSYLTVGRATDFTVIKLTSSGVDEWVYHYDGGAGALDRAYSVAYGADGNVYAAGNCWVGGGAYWDFTIVSLPPSGPPVNWIYEYDGPGSEMDNSDAAYAIVYGHDGNIYAAGKSYGSGTWRDFTVVSVTDSGTQRWVYRHNGSANLDDIASSIAFGADGNIYAAGFARNANRDMYVVSLPPSGPPVNWDYTYNGLGNGDDAASSIAWGSDGNVYVAGYSTGADTSEDFTVISLTAGGIERWAYAYDGPAHSSDGATSIVYGPGDNIYAAGGSTDSVTGYDFTVINLDTSGTDKWIYRYDGPGNADDQATSIVMGGDGNVYAAGHSEGIGTDEDFTVISLRPEVSIEERLINDQLSMTKSQLLQIRPNPFAHSATISYSVTSAVGGPRTAVNLSIYDLAGRLVRTFLDEPSHHLTIQPSNQVVWDGRDKAGRAVPAGIYFCRLAAGQIESTKKMILLK